MHDWWYVSQIQTQFDFFHLRPRQKIFLSDRAEFVINSHELFFDFLIRKQGKIDKFKLVWTGKSIIHGYRYFAYICIKFVQIDFLCERILVASNAYFRRRCTCGYLVKWSTIWSISWKIICFAKQYMFNSYNLWIIHFSRNFIIGTWNLIIIYDRSWSLIYSGSSSFWPTYVGNVLATYVAMIFLDNSKLIKRWTKLYTMWATILLMAYLSVYKFSDECHWIKHKFFFCL